MKHPRHWVYWLCGLVALAVAGGYVQHDARAQALGPAESYGLYAVGSVDGPVKNIVAATYAIPASEDGYTYTNYGTAVNLVLTLPLTPRLGWSATFICAASQTSFVAFNANTGAVITSTSGSSTSGGNLVSAGANTLSVKVKYVNTNTFTVVSSNGVATTNYTLN